MRRVLLIAVVTAAWQASPAFADAAPELRSVSHGLTVQGGFGTSLAGDTILGSLGGETVGAQTFDARAWLMAWDAALVLQGGILGNEHPYLPLIGGRLAGDVEFGRRLQPALPWSVYVGAGLNGVVSLLGSPGVGLGAFNTINNVGGVGGFILRDALRVAVGASFIDGSWALLLEAFFQEALRAPGVNLPGAAFSEGGVRARFDVTRSWLVIVALFAGATPTTLHSDLNYRESSAHEEADLTVRKTFGNGMWVGGAVSIADETHHQEYRASQRSYDTADAPTFGVALEYGFPLGSQE
jgi:hypothetical protein